MLLPIDIQLELFNSMVLPILLYGVEVWDPYGSDFIDKLRLKFYKLITNTRKSTPTLMIQGELGVFPSSV